MDDSRPHTKDRVPRRSAIAWYEDLDIYQVHVRAFFDSNSDGIGDLRGLTQKLSYIRDLGVGAVWLSPIYPSPLRDGGYDVTDFKNVHPDLGTLDDLKQLLHRAHDAGLRVILDLVLNHTSDQHPWFHSARRGPGHPYHDYYVWSPLPNRFGQARIIFPEKEKSNWALAPECGLYYWHRFFCHQPDLNYDNPEVRREMLDVARFWLNLGADGFRVDAAPYLFEREGTTCESLPETHEFLRELRRVGDTFDPPRILLAEANQNVNELVAYFGKGDEFHLAFHFPLMPRLFMAIRSETSKPVIDTIRSIPALPKGCQWAMFLRNHDELSLEMVSAQERDYMLSAFAAQPGMRLNLGIRRRLWPLMMGGRRQIEFLHALVLGLPGCAVFYYGDEIGMGDDVQLDDRLGVRTPMQWSSGRNAGFSDADPSRLEVPPVTSPEYHYAGHNVESEERLPTSFLNWFRRIVKAHREVRGFRSRELELVSGNNPGVLTFVREQDSEAVLCVYNLSRFVQHTLLDLSKWRGRSPIEAIGRSAFPQIEGEHYPLALAPHGFYWLLLQSGLAIKNSSPTIRQTILFVCQYNSARSQLAEAIARSLAPSHVEILSAGLTRSVVNAEVIRALAEIGLDAASQTSKSLDELVCDDVDDVFVLCEEAQEPAARRFPHALHHFWPMLDPVASPDPRVIPTEVRRTRDELRERLKAWFEGVKAWR